MGNKKCRSVILAAVLVCLGGCIRFGGITGTYTDGAGAFVLDLRSGGEATFTFMGNTAQCTYNQEKDKLNLKCKGDAGNTVMTIHDDGSLTGPPGTFMPVLRKSK